MRIDEIKGQENVKRACEIATVGKHSVLLIGPPLCGKRSIADAFKSNIETLTIYPGDTIDLRIKYQYDMIIEVVPVPVSQLLSSRKSESDEDILSRIENAGKYSDTRLGESHLALLKNAAEKLELMPGQIFKIISVARSIANLDQSKEIRLEHLAEAIQYQSINLQP